MFLVGVHKDVFERRTSEVHVGPTEKTKAVIVFTTAGQLVNPSLGMLKNHHHQFMSQQVFLVDTLALPVK